ncbi:MAG: protein kinase [Acidobacteriota bacterium]|nr:protein kinase [Acidobacteriota bacterium]
MNAERWKQVKNIYQLAIETAPERRASVLTAECGGNAALRAEVEELLRFEGKSEDFIEEPAFDFAVGLIAEDERLPAEKQIGNYHIVREIGRGGMGAVYLAERTDGLFEQRIALKIIKRGMDTDAILKRFTMERQILANLDHPNIARMLDGGTTADGLPYFVMEFIEGEPIHNFCDRKNLNLTERLQLFRKVCAAVSYAHQNLIVHRDLKPSNILVTEAGEPKLLDFGIAKLLHSTPTGETQATETIARMLTPEYASPEQLTGARITTLSDVYSLGVLLDKLIFGNSRNTRKTGTSRTFDRDLRVILQTARREEPARRYPSVEAFSDDLRRLLEGLPVKAQRDSFIYRSSKFVRRNAATVSFAVLAVFALAFAAAFSAWQARRASAAQIKAERRFNDVRKLANAVLFEYHDAIEELPKSTEIREKMLKDSLAYLDSLSAEAADDKELLRELGKAYEKVGTIQGNTYVSNVGETSAMLESYRKSLEIREKLAAMEPANHEFRRELANSLENLGDALHITGELRKALENYEKAREIIVELAAKDEKQWLYLARLHNNIANVQGFPGRSNLGDVRGATENYRASMEITRKLYESDPKNTKYRFGYALYLRNYGNILLFKGDAAAALEQVKAALPLVEAWYREEPENRTPRDMMSGTLSKLSDVYAELGDFPRAIEFAKKAIAIDEPAYLADPKDARAREVYIFYMKLASVLSKMKNFDEAEKYLRKSLAIVQSAASENAANTELKSDLAEIKHKIANLKIERGQFGEVRPLLEQSLKLYEEIVALDSSNVRELVNAAQVRVSIGDLLARQKQFAAAVAEYEKALPVLTEQSQPDKIGAPVEKHLNELEIKIKEARAKI